VSVGEQVECRDDVELLVHAAAVQRAEVEAQGMEPGGRVRLPERRDDRMGAVATELRVRVADDHDAAWVLARGGEQVTRQHVPVGGRQLHSFHPSDGTLGVMAAADDKLPIKMLNDRLLVRVSKEDGERRSSGGILIPATAQMAKRLVWAEVVALGPNVRSVEVGDLVLFSAEDRYEVEVQGQDYIMLREREIHAVAAERIEASTGLYL
jgi:chaperonin GroES